MMFRRGFKSWCEGTAAQVRRRLGLKSVDPLSPEALANLLGVRLWTLGDLSTLPAEVRDRLVGVHTDVWSAVTIADATHPVIIFNPAHSEGRRSSDIMHELAHLLLQHTPGNMFFGPGGLALRTHNPEQEAEASWLSACLLLPRDCLLTIRRRQMPPDEACRRYAVSREMLRFRLNSTGVELQFARALRRPSSPRLS